MIFGMLCLVLFQLLSRCGAKSIGVASFLDAYFNMKMGLHWQISSPWSIYLEY